MEPKSKPKNKFYGLVIMLSLRDATQVPKGRPKTETTNLLVGGRTGDFSRRFPGDSAAKAAGTGSFKSDDD